MVKRSKEGAKKTFLKLYHQVLQEQDLSDEKIARILNCPYTTLKQTVSQAECNSNKLNADIVISFCYQFGFDVNYIYYGETKEPQLGQDEQYTLFRHSADCHELKDKSFFGTFYGYTMNTKYDKLDSFELEITQSPRGQARAVMSIHSHSQNPDGSFKLIHKTLYGKPMHLEPSLIYIVLQADKGDDYWVMTYRFLKLNNRPHLYCRYGAMITAKRTMERIPQMQAFAFMDAPVRQEDLHYVKGFLKLAEDRIIVPADHLDDEKQGLRTTNPAVISFLSQCKNIRFRKEYYYCFSEKVLLALGESENIPSDITARTIATLKEHSINPATVCYPDNNLYSLFLKGLTEG